MSVEKIEVWKFAKGASGDVSKVLTLDLPVETMKTLTTGVGCATGPIVEYDIEVVRVNGDLYRVSRKGLGQDKPHIVMLGDDVAKR